MKKVLLYLFIGAIISLGLVSCGKSSEDHPHTDHPSAEQHKGSK